MESLCMWIGFDKVNGVRLHGLHLVIYTENKQKRTNGLSEGACDTRIASIMLLKSRLTVKRS